jgi:transcription elongation factor GreA-like protein
VEPFTWVCERNKTTLFIASLAQMAEHSICNREVKGSIPLIGTIEYMKKNNVKKFYRKSKKMLNKCINDWEPFDNVFSLHMALLTLNLQYEYFSKYSNSSRRFQNSAEIYKCICLLRLIIDHDNVDIETFRNMIKNFTSYYRDHFLNWID